MNDSKCAQTYRHDRRFVLRGPLDDSPPGQVRRAALAVEALKAVDSVNHGSHSRRIEFEPRWLDVVGPGEPCGTVSWSGYGIRRSYSAYVLTALIAVAWWMDGSARLHVRVVGLHGKAAKGRRRAPHRELDNPFAGIRALFAVYPELSLARPGPEHRRGGKMCAVERGLLQAVSRNPLDASSWDALARLWLAAGAGDHAAKAARVAAMIPDVISPPRGDG